MKIYVRNSKKYGKILTVPREVSARRLYELAAESQNLSAEEVHLFLGGKAVDIAT